VSRAPRTDYESIASSYDEDRKQWEIPRDDVIAAAFVTGAAGLDVLDVGCGTGLWITAQRSHFPGAPLRWTGLDPSAAMLAEARAKAPHVGFVRAFAEAIPLRTDRFDYVFSSFVYHHFADKHAALDEIARVLRPGGTLRIRNIQPAHMESWWVYRYFPGTRELDDLRFLSADALTDALRRRGFDVDVSIEPEVRTTPAAEIVAEAERRVVSQLAILDDDGYQAGLDLLRAVGGPIVTEWAVLTLTASYSSAQTRS